MVSLLVVDRLHEVDGMHLQQSLDGINFASTAKTSDALLTGVPLKLGGPTRRERPRKVTSRGGCREVVPNYFVLGRFAAFITATRDFASTKWRGMD